MHGCTRINNNLSFSSGTSGEVDATPRSNFCLKNVTSFPSGFRNFLVSVFVVGVFSDESTMDPRLSSSDTQKCISIATMLSATSAAQVSGSDTTSPSDEKKKRTARNLYSIENAIQLAQHSVTKKKTCTSMNYTARLQLRTGSYGHVRSAPWQHASDNPAPPHACHHWWLIGLVSCQLRCLHQPSAGSTNL